MDKSITNSTPLAEEQVDQTLVNITLTKKYNHFLNKVGHWQYVVELFAGSVVLAFLLVLAEAQGWNHFNGTKLIQYILFIDWVLFASLVFQISFERFFAKMHLASALILNFLLVQVIVFVTTITLNFSFYLGSNLGITGFNQIALFEGVILNLSYGILLGAFCFRYIYVREQWLRQQQSELQAKIDALQARIHPHFLFNSLNNVVCLISTEPEKAENLLLNLSRLFRASLQEFKLVSLKDELELCQKYLEIEKNRLGKRLNIEWKFEQSDLFSEIQIPLLTLQPLLENSIFHGVEKNLEPSTVSILIEVLQNKVNIVITNPYVPVKMNIRQHHGIAIKNVKQRLEAYYGQSVIFRTHQADKTYTTFIQYRYK